jgi:hypothetical protein
MGIVLLVWGTDARESPSPGIAAEEVKGVAEEFIQRQMKFATIEAFSPLDQTRVREYQGVWHVEGWQEMMRKSGIERLHYHVQIRRGRETWYLVKLEYR